MTKAKAIFIRGTIKAEDINDTRELYDSSRFGEPKDGKLQYSLVEGLYLIEKKKIDVYDGKNKKLTFDGYVRKATKLNKNFWIDYSVFRDLRSRGYIVKTALKFGAEFRVYDRGVKPGDDHAKWIVFPIHESETLTWYEYAAKNRVAHSTRKRLLLAIVDDEGAVSFWESRWIRP